MNNIPAVVYFIACKGFIKIGRCRKHNFGKYRKTSNNCVGELQRGNPFKLEVIAFIEFPSESEAKTQEKKLHAHFKDLCHRGEWHHDAPELRDYIRNHATAYESTHAKLQGISLPRGKC
ncbi:MAG: GIY-YIG nuclease family protein [Candidatus Poribacteria bacterium]|nr:GIY-YIG nuclease family protein [Candidatus Poribacteria bacterium]